MNSKIYKIRHKQSGKFFVKGTDSFLSINGSEWKTKSGAQNYFSDGIIYKWNNKTIPNDVISYARKGSGSLSLSFHIENIKHLFEVVELELKETNKFEL